MTTGKKSTKRMGRPTKAPRPGERVSLGLRVTADIKTKLDEAAKRAGRSQSQEAEFRLEQSFAEEDRLGGPQVIELVKTIASAMESTGRHAGFYETRKLTNRGQWMALPYAYNQAAQAAMAVLEHHSPPGKIVPPKLNAAEIVGGDSKQSRQMMREFRESLGTLIAKKEIRDRESEK